jgi:osmoprotectant transport system permease protein
MSLASTPLASVFDSFSGAFDFIFNSRESVDEAVQVGGLDQVAEFLWTHVWISALALAIALVIALPVGVYLGHRGTGELLAVAVGNAGRAIPELALIAIMIAFVGVGETTASPRSSPTPSSASARSTATRSRPRGAWG